MDNITGNEPINPIKEQPFIYELPDGTRRIDHGLTIRQHFAAMAMQGLLANSELITASTSKTVKEFAESFVTDAVLMADTLIEELNKY